MLFLALGYDEAHRMTLFPTLFAPETIEEYGIDLGNEIIYSARGGRIEAVTSSPRALEGRRAPLHRLTLAYEA